MRARVGEPSPPPGPTRAWWRAALQGPGRHTNLALLVVLVLAFGTGMATVAVGAAGGSWVAVSHGIVGVAVILLIPWKTRVARAGMRRPRAGRWASLLLAALTLVTLVAGLGSATGLVREIAVQPAVWVHIAVALVMIPLVVWHLVARPVLPRRTDLSRRALLRVGVIGAGAIGLYAAAAVAVTGFGLPGARRRFTGSYATASLRANAFPTTSWLFDAVPAVDAGDWRLALSDGAGTRQLSYAELARFDTRVAAVLDCTSGWYTQQEWTGVPLSALVSAHPGARSVYVHSLTGYWVRYPIGDLERLLLATRVGGEQLTADHGFPARIVAPGRRGYWWVKWVDRIDVQPTPAWWQPPFPLG